MEEAASVSTASQYEMCVDFWGLKEELKVDSAGMGRAIANQVLEGRFACTRGRIKKLEGG